MHVLTELSMKLLVLALRYVMCHHARFHQYSILVAKTRKPTEEDILRAVK